MEHSNVLFFSFALALAIVSSEQTIKSDSPTDGIKGNCSCGGFPTSSPTPDSVPLLSQSPGLVVNCDEEGAGTCKSLCLALATATKAKGPEILCYRLKDADELKLSAFYKVCDKPWVYADMTAEDALCCQESKVKVCTSGEHVNTTTGTNAST
ncbi:unnamed protein product [Leptidea sinapis]|uniref:Follicle cell protein 3C-1 n=1 Tax=Leptidea sinapis TaxID=189913 RepID=A0A5E4PS95_9NEOP|nr:unnamed protein product [Leptidea sinapis]